MKNFVFLILCLIFVSCSDKGETIQKLNGDEPNLPPELKGLKVYYVSYGSQGGVFVAKVEDQPITLTYKQGKTTTSTICLLDKKSKRIVDVNQILLENDSLIICKKQ